MHDAVHDIRGAPTAVDDMTPGKHLAETTAGTGTP